MNITNDNIFNLHNSLLNKRKSGETKGSLAQSTRTVEYTDCFFDQE